MQPDSESVMAMNIVKKSSQGFQLLELEALLASGRVIEVYGEIDNDLAMNCVRQMLYYASEDKFTPVKILINTPGGSMDAGMLIYDVLQTSEVPFDVYCTGAAYSMGALLFATAPRGHRFILPHSKVMIHEPLVASNVVGKTSSVQDLADSLLATQERIFPISTPRSPSCARSASASPCCCSRNPSLLRCTATARPAPSSITATPISTSAGWT